MLNWLDIVLIVILVITLILGIWKGLIRQLVGILAVILGLVLAWMYYDQAGSMFKPLVTDDFIAHFIGFFIIFLIVLLIGWIISRLFSKALKGSFKVMNHILGGLVGLIKGGLICGILTFALLVFPVNIKALKNSLLAPYCLKMAVGVIELVPKDIKNKFKAAHEEIFGIRGENNEGG